jgi:hypothetical protein
MHNEHTLEISHQDVAQNIKQYIMQKDRTNDPRENWLNLRLSQAISDSPQSFFLFNVGLCTITP